MLYKFVLLQYSDFFTANQLLYYIVKTVDLALFYIFAYGLGIAVFNLLPLYPLDGFRVIESFTRQINPVRRFLRNYGMYILIALVVESFLCNILVKYTDLPYVSYFNILGWVSWFAQNIIGYPITALWGLII